MKKDRSGDRGAVVPGQGDKSRTARQNVALDILEEREGLGRQPVTPAGQLQQAVKIGAGGGTGGKFDREVALLGLANRAPDAAFQAGKVHRWFGIQRQAMSQKPE